MSRRGQHMSPGAHALPANASRTNRRAAVRFLDAIDRARLSPVDVLVLLHVVDAEATVTNLAEQLDRRPGDIRRATGRLVARGLLRRRRDRTIPRGLVFTATASGRDVLASLEAPSSFAGAGDGDRRRPARGDGQHRRLRAGCAFG